MPGYCSPAHPSSFPPNMATLTLLEHNRTRLESSTTSNYFSHLSKECFIFSCFLKGWFIQKSKFCHHLHPSSSSKPVWMSLFCWTQKKILKNVGNRAVLRNHWLPQYCFPTLEVNGSPKQPVYKLTSKYLPLFSEQIHSYRFGTTWGWVNDFWVNYSFNNLCLLFGTW